MRVEGFIVTLGMLLSTSPVAFGQQQPAPGEASGQYVPRAEYERLKQEFDALKKQVQQIQQQQASRISENEGAASIQKSEGFALLPDGELTPGWERVRAPGWMGPGHLERMNARIAQVGEMDLYMGLDTVGRFQWLGQGHVADTVGSDSVLSGPLSPGFQTAYGNFSFLADFEKQMEVYFNVFIADSPHPDKLQGDEGYMLIRQLPDALGETRLATAIFDNIDVKAGQFELDFGDAHYRRSLNAAVQHNPLIGNYVIDPRSTEIGLEVSSDAGRFPVNWLIGVGSGGEAQDFQKNHALSLHGKLWGHPTEHLRTSSSIYWTDQSDTPTSSRSNLFRANRSGSPYAGVLDNSSAAGDVLPVEGQRVLATQFDATWEDDPVELYGHFGWVQDGDTNGDSSGSPRTSWLYYAAEGSYHFTDRLYGALRYSGASA
ncbi:MAG: hypothetical protein Q8R78_02125, partial [Candidatus Omnitrophota bacterium]|nr:hypothetical protein [Candidatus Omnitrophota bacterium]